MLIVSDGLSDSAVLHRATPEDLVAMRQIVSAILLAANCLLVLKEYQDCLTLLAPLIKDADSRGGDAHYVEQLQGRARSICGDSRTDINAFAGEIGYMPPGLAWPGLACSSSLRAAI